MYRNALTLIHIFGVKTISPLHQKKISYLPQFSSNPVEGILKYVDTRQEFSIPQQEMGDRLVGRQDELGLLAMGTASGS